MFSDKVADVCSAADNPSPLLLISVHRIDPVKFFFLWFGAVEKNYNARTVTSLTSGFSRSGVSRSVGFFGKISWKILSSRWFVNFTLRWFTTKIQLIIFVCFESILYKGRIVIGWFVPLCFVQSFFLSTIIVGYFDIQNFLPWNMFDEHFCYLIKSISIRIFYSSRYKFDL